MKNEPLVLERTFDADVDSVWEALTDNSKMKQWYFDIAAFKPEVGFRFTFTAENKGVQFVHLCEVTVAEPGKKLAYSWKYEGQPGSSEVTFELFPEGKKTRLKLTHTGLETFPSDTGDYKRENFLGGWTYILDTSLKGFLEKA
ncbi:MAG TPA: SRPBCC domain-containing protein [Chitinophaga sp.]|uniref:SRPBCC family protein n=1 Tax=Chitinophaga sp. TaxID=1869181 RepID=UPI002D13DDFB|nr:SRPBCC domain-containing protein [Chitinophaga sp.]HVI44634.1 SRPBCC domain-containing protein [Chitinophaga sp.]